MTHWLKKFLGMVPLEVPREPTNEMHQLMEKLDYQSETMDDYGNRLARIEKRIDPLEQAFGQMGRALGDDD